MFYAQVLLSAKCWGNLSQLDTQRLILDCFRSRATSTVSRYMRESRRFINFQKSKGSSVNLPAEVTNLVLFLSSLLHKNTKSATQVAYAALRWVHGILPIKRNPLDSMICKNLIEAKKGRHTFLLTRKNRLIYNLSRPSFIIMLRKGAISKTSGLLQCVFLPTPGFSGLRNC